MTPGNLGRVYLKVTHENVIYKDLKLSLRSQTRAPACVREGFTTTRKIALLHEALVLEANRNDGLCFIYHLYYLADQLLRVDNRLDMNKQSRTVSNRFREK